MIANSILAIGYDLKCCHPEFEDNNKANHIIMVQIDLPFLIDESKLAYNCFQCQTCTL